MILESKRLLLKHPEKEDIEALLEIRNSTFVLRYNPLFPYTLKQLWEEIQTSIESTLCLIHKDSNKLIGAVFWEKDKMRYRVDALTISYYLKEEYSHQGYMSEALHEIIPVLLQNCFVVSARAYEDNKASCSLLEKLGFHKDGVLRYALTHTDGIIHHDVLYSITKADNPLFPRK